MRYYKKSIAGILLFSLTLTTYAQPWQFSTAVDVTTTTGPGIFHHLESSGRRNIAVSENTVAVVWEDNRDDKPQIYLASKKISTRAFTGDIKISGKGEAYEPSLVALDNERFVVAWEEDTRIHARLLTAAGPGPTLVINQQAGFQASLARHRQQLFLVYSSKNTKYQQIRLQQLTLDGQKLRLSRDCPVDAQAPTDDQLYPSAISLGDRIIVAWEDRRPGHTIIMAAQSLDKTPCQFSRPQRISEAPGKRTSSYGKGHGVARVAMARYASDKVMAVWADKRDYRQGYDIYAAHYQVGNNSLFGKNVKVQDSFGGLARQWHATVSGNDSGQLVVAWDDNRDGDANILLSWLENNQWSDDIEAETASGPGEQAHPSIALDADGNLHLAWVERSTMNSATRLRYTFARALKK